MTNTKSRWKILISSKPPERAPFPPSSAPPQRLHLQLKSKLDRQARTIIRNVVRGLPGLFGSPICVLVRPHLKAHRGKLISGFDAKGMPVHAASFIRQRLIILETELLSHSEKLKLIAVHEVFHFVWVRLGNRKRAEYSAIVAAELQAHARGELGESAEGWKCDIVTGGDLKNYICESFCDTAAWLYSGVRRNRELTLSLRWRKRRQSWFNSTFSASGVNVC